MKNKKSNTRKAVHKDKREKNWFEKKEMSKQVIRVVQKGKLSNNKRKEKHSEKRMSKIVTEK